MTTYAVTLPCDATSVQATDPVAWGLTSLLVTGASVMWNYGYLFTSFSKLRADPTEEEKALLGHGAFRYGDILFMNFLLYLGAVGVAIAALQQYVNQNLSRSSAVFNILAPQDVTNVVFFGLSMVVLTFHRFYQIYLVFGTQDGVKIPGKIEDSSRRSACERILGIMVPMCTLLVMVLFGGIYGYQQSIPAGISTCGGAPVERFPVATYPGSVNVQVAHLATSIILAAGLLLHFGWPIFEKSPITSGVVDAAKMEQDLSNAWERLLSYQSYVFDVINSPTQKRSLLMGWLPTLHLGFWWTLAFSWFFAQVHIFTHYDMYKVLGVYFCTSFLALALSAFSGSLDCFSSFFFASVFVFELIQYAAATLLYPVKFADVTVPQQTIDFGLFLTGPATLANMNNSTVTGFVYIGLILSALALLSELYLRYDSNKKKYRVAVMVVAD